MFPDYSSSKGPLQLLLTAILIGMLPVANAVVGAPDDTAWTLQKQAGDIRVYTREIPDSSYLAIKATVLIDAPAARIAELMGDGNGCTKWRSKCRSSRVIEAVSEHERYVHLVLDLPWPASDRDLVLHSVTQVDAPSRTATVSLVSDSSKHPPQKYVRAESRGKFVIRSITEHQIEFTYFMHTDLGGNLPAGSVNAGLVDAAFEDLSRLQKLAEG